MTTVRIRPAGPQDATAITEIWHLGWQDAHVGNVPEELRVARTLDTFTERAQQRTTDDTAARTLVAVADDAVVGFVMVVDDEVEQVYVARTSRGSGVAAELLDAAEGVVRSAGHAEAWLAVVAGNTIARRFYERRGWTDAGAFDHHAPGGFVVPAHKYVKLLVR